MRIMDNYKMGTKVFSFLPDEFPDELLSRDWAYHIHGQTLERLSERGGMSIMELLMNLKKIGLQELISTYGYNYVPTEENARDLAAYISEPF
jgi:hypothetical protein